MALVYTSCMEIICTAHCAGAEAKKDARHRRRQQRTSGINRDKPQKKRRCSPFSRYGFFFRRNRFKWIERYFFAVCGQDAMMLSLWFSCASFCAHVCIHSYHRTFNTEMAYILSFMTFLWPLVGLPERSIWLCSTAQHEILDRFFVG